ncbi:MAG: helix-turn-helix transcriptional regulator [Ktedonobacteraceae bacterium]|nr:helix-turn-helix transcriptional regulator [Ktedonobacteraceae bacterium]MBO0796577.1 helix-turn-helix transcriptional regulator [Ktedonobacteraceae bacterium]
METTVPVPAQRFTDLNHLALSLRLGSFNSEILGWGYFEPRWWRNYLHTHSFFEVCYAFQGRGLFRLQDHDYQIRAGQVFVAGPGETHEIIAADDEPLGIYFWSYTLVPTEQGTARDSDTLLNAFLTGHRPLATPGPSMQQTLNLLTEEAARREAGYTQAIEGLVTKLLLDTARAVTDTPPITDPPSTPVRNADEAVTRLITRYLRDNYRRPLSLRDLAAQVHLSERHTARIFQKTTGISPMEYLCRLRIDIATQLLLDRQLPIKEIAQAIGYPDVRYFGTLFRQRTGFTPAAFRRDGGTRFIDSEEQRAAINPGYETAPRAILSSPGPESPAPSPAGAEPPGRSR